MKVVKYCPICFSIECDCLMDKAVVKFTNLCPHILNIRLRGGGILELPEEIPLRSNNEAVDLAIPFPVNGVALRYHIDKFPPKLFNHFYISSLNVARLAWEEGRNNFVTVHRVSTVGDKKVAEKLSFSPNLVFGRLDK